MQFPVVTGSNLLRQKLQLPADLQGEINLLLIPFYQWHQALVDSWAPLAAELEMNITGFRFYELPVIQRMNPFAQTFINEGMRAGIPNQSTRQRTITLYLDKVTFRNDLELPSEDTIYALLVDRHGNVLWKIEGAFSPEKGKALLATLQQLHPVIGFERS
jgi:ATP10 protein